MNQTGSVNNKFKKNKDSQQNRSVEVQIYGQKCNIIGDEDIEQIKMLARFVDERMKEISKQSRGIPAIKIAILAALNITHDLYKSQEKTKHIALKGEKLLSLLDGIVEERD